MPLNIITKILVAIFIAMQWRTRKLKKDHRHLENEIQKRTWQIEADKKIIEQDKQLIEQQAEDLKALDKTKSRFFANITHEFRTPLTLIKGPIEQMMANPPSPTTLKKRLSGMQKNTDNLLKLINQLLDLSKLESKQMKVVISYNDITRYTKELVHRFEPLANHKRLHLEFTTTTTHWKTYFDTDKWSKILYNLLSNAIKFTSEGGFIKVHLRQLRKAEQKYIQLQVVDTGIGIKPKKLEHIFNRFYQADASATRLQGGTGIGLALVKELTTLQNGTVTVNSTVGKGTEFTVTLPITPTLVDKPIIMEDILLPTVGEEIPIENKQITITSYNPNDPLCLILSIGGTQRDVFWHIAKECFKRESPGTGPIEIKKYFSEIGASIGVVRMTISRLSTKGVIQKINGKLGRNGFSFLVMPEIIFSNTQNLLKEFFEN